MQKEWEPNNPHLYSLWGFRYCNFLLTQGRGDEVRPRATQMFDKAPSWYPRLSIALDQLALGRSCMWKAQQTTTSAASPVFAEAKEWLQLAVTGLRGASQLDYLPLGLLARAAWARVAKQFDQAHRDLAEAFTIAERGEMRLHLADCYLEFARLSLATGDRDSTRRAWETAKAMVDEMGYHRRDGEVAEIEAQLNAE